jgi:hypothetical protein
MDVDRPTTVFSSWIYTAALLMKINQRWMLGLLRFAETLLPLLHDDESKVKCLHRKSFRDSRDLL